MHFNQALAAAADEANRQMKREGRIVWSYADFNLAIDTVDHLWPNPWDIRELAEQKPPLGEPL
jgi:hypothetical protein